MPILFGKKIGIEGRYFLHNDKIIKNNIIAVIVY